MELHQLMDCGTVVTSTQPVNTTVQDTLAERGKTHGDYSNHARITQEIKRSIRIGRERAGRSEYIIPDWMEETIDMIAHKLGRIGAGDPDFADHWRDIAGYATLAEERCSK